MNTGELVQQTLDLIGEGTFDRFPKEEIEKLKVETEQQLNYARRNHV